MKKIILACCIIFSFNLSWAQTDPKAVEILEKASQEIKNSTFTVIDFTLQIDNPQIKSSQKVPGSIQLHKEKMFITTPYAEILYDGKAQYVHLKDVNEITISQPNKEELQQFNPSFFLESYKKNFRIPQPAIVVENNQRLYSIDLFPENIKESFFRVNIKIHADKLDIVSITTYEKSGVSSAILVNKIQKNASLNTTIFQFDAKKHPKAEIIDLR